MARRLVATMPAIERAIAASGAHPASDSGIGDLVDSTPAQDHPVTLNPAD